MHCYQTFPYGVDDHTQASQAPQIQAANWQRLKLIADRVHAQLDDDQILQAIVRELGTMPVVGNCGAMLYDSDQQQWHTRYTHSALSASEQRFTHSIEERLNATSLHQQHPFLFCPIDLAPRSSRSSSHQPLEILVSPIVAKVALNAPGQTVMGILWLSKRASHETHFSEADMQLVEQVTTQYAIALQQRHLLQAAQSQVEQGAKLNELRTSFLDTISHELRTPLAHMKLGLTMLQIALNDDGNLTHEPSAKAAYYLKLVQDACEQEIQLINDLLVLQQLEAGTYPLLPNAIPLQDWLSEIVQSFEAKALEQYQRLRLRMDEALPRLVCDLILLDRVMRELLTNACKFTPANGDITITAQVVSGAIHISVVNSGIEISASELDRVFDKFYRVPTDDPWKHQGTGLGLALVQRLVTYLGGTIQVTSTHHQVCFVMALPHTQPEREVAGRDRLMSYVAYYLSRGKTLISPVYGALSFTGLVYDYWGYHPNFLSFWQRLQQRQDFGCLYLEKETVSFRQFLDDDYTVSQCARCRLPISNPAGKAYTTPSCTLCDDQLLREPTAPSNTIATNANTSAITHVLAIGKLADHTEALQQWFKLNGFEVSFVATPDAITFDALPESVELILLVEALSELQAQAWVQTLRHYTQLRHTPIIALSANAGCGQTWMDGVLSLEDYLITPLNGDHLAHHLQQMTEPSQAANEPCWFPLYG